MAALPVVSEQCVAQRPGQRAECAGAQQELRAAPRATRPARCGPGRSGPAWTDRRGRRPPAAGRPRCVRRWPGGTAAGRPPTRRCAWSAPRPIPGTAAPGTPTMNSSSTSQERKRRSSLVISLQLPGHPQPGDVHLRWPARADQHPQGVRPQLRRTAPAPRSAAEPAISCRSSRHQDRAGTGPAVEGSPAGALIVATGAPGRRGQSCSARPRWATSVASVASSRGHPVPGHRRGRRRPPPRPGPAASSCPTPAVRPPGRAGWLSGASSGSSSRRAGQARRLRSAQLLGQDDGFVHGGRHSVQVEA